MKRKWIVALFAALLPMCAAAQLAPEKPQRAENPDDALRWKVYAGFGYTSLNQVNQSRYGLIGVNVEGIRNFGRFWGVVADGGFYPTSYASGNPGNPSVDMVLFGPEAHGPIFEKWNIFGHALIGGEHTGGTGQTPSVSFAGGIGGGVEYVLSHHLVMRASGDDIASSFSLTNNTPQLGYSPHKRWNARASVGVAYRF